MYRHIFGPVPSRRLGNSLGIDLVPLKTCNLNCIYCECGRTTHLTMERREYVPFEQVCEELTRFLSENPPPDWLTFSGSGEPLLYSRAGELLEWIKGHAPDIPLAILTNGTLFTDPEVRREVQRADLILPSLDAATPALYRKIDRPHPQLQVEKIIEGLVELRCGYSGRIWLEVFIVPGLNDQESELSALREAILRIAPDRVQLNSLDRPGTLLGLRAADRAELERIIEFWQLPRVEIVARSASDPKPRTVRTEREGAILETIARRPCTLEDLVQILGMHINEVNKYLAILEKEGKIHTQRAGPLLFYAAGGQD